MAASLLSMEQIVAAAQQRRALQAQAPDNTSTMPTRTQRPHDVVALAQTLHDEIANALGPRLTAVRPQLDRLGRWLPEADRPTGRMQLLLVLDELEDQLEALLR